jgi:L-malate glycosyltransferase
MKILHLSSERTWRGGEQQIAYLMQQLREKNIATLAAARKDSEFAKRMLAQGFEVIELPFKSELDLFTAWKVRELVKRHKVDIVHMHSGHSHTIGVLSSVLGHSAPLVLSKRTDYPVRDNKFSQWKFNYPGIKRILTVSAKIKDVIKPSLKRPELVEVVYSGIDVSKFPDSPQQNIRELVGLPPMVKVVTNTSAIAEQKDYPTFVAVAKLLTQKYADLYFVICGDGPLKASIETLVKDQGLEERVRFTGFRSDLPSFLGSADLFLITSQDEGLGTSILDAFGTRVPVVGTAAGGMPEIIRHEDTGLMAPIKDAATLAGHVERLLYQDAATRERLVKNARALAEEFSYKRTAEQTVAVYKNLVASHSL